MSKKKIIKVALIAILNLNFAQAQPFFPVGGGTDNAILSLFADATTSILYAGGQFSQAGNIQSLCIAKWNGIDWDSTRNQFVNPGLSQIRSIAKFNNEIYIAGPFGMYDTAGNLTGDIAKWDTIINAWVNFGANVNGSDENIYVYNNDLYITGKFDSIGGIYSEKIVRYDGINFYAFPPLDTLNGGWAITDVIFYNTDLYVGGNFNGTAGPNMKDLAKWDGSQWLPVANGLSGGFTWVNDFTIYQGKLIVAGYFSTASGDPGNSIAAWDGTQWTQLGAVQITGQVWDVEVYNGELWAGGGFVIDIGGNTISYLAKWNGTQWDSLGITLNNAVTSMAVLGNDLFIGGAFWTMNGDTVNRIIRYNPLTGFESLEPEDNKIEIYPNPTSATLNIKNLNSHKIKNIYIFNSLGEKVKTFKAANTIFIGDLPKGLYLVQIRNDKGIVHTQRIVIE